MFGLYFGLSLVGFALGWPQSRASTIYLPGGGATYGTPRVETPYNTTSPDTFVKTSVVSLFVPLNTSVVGEHPQECDYIVSSAYHSAVFLC